MTLAEAVAYYLKRRDLLEALKKQHKAKEAVHQEALDRLEGFFLENLNAIGAQHIASPAGTVYRTEHLRASVADWPPLFDWIRANEAWNYLERRVSKTAVEEGLASDDKILPPGVNISRVFAVNVRRS